MLKVREKVLCFLNPLNQFSAKTIWNAIFNMEKSFLKKFSITRCTIGLELEFYFLSKPSELLLHEISLIPFVHEIKTELGHHQYEITTVPLHSFLEASDAFYYIQHELNRIAKMHNTEISLQAVYNQEQPPSSMQINICLFAQHTTAPLSLNNVTFMKVLQNIVANVNSAMYLSCPTADCYDRIANRGFVEKYKNSPTHATWGTENRTVAVRIAKIPNSNFGNRIEYRTPSPIADPYHLLLVILSSAMCDTNVYHPQTFVDSAQSQEKPLPRTYFEAIQAFANSKIHKKIEYFCKKNAL